MRVHDRACAGAYTGTSLGFSIGALEHVGTRRFERVHSLLATIGAIAQADLSRIDAPKRVEDIDVVVFVVVDGAPDTFADVADAL